MSIAIRRYELSVMAHRCAVKADSPRRSLDRHTLWLCDDWAQNGLVDAEQTYRERYAEQVRRVHYEHGGGASVVAWAVLRRKAQREANAAAEGDSDA